MLGLASKKTWTLMLGTFLAIWAVQDKLALNVDEEKAIELKRELVNGQERTVWNPVALYPR